MRMILAGAVAAAVMSLAACGGSGPSPSACKAAMQASYAKALQDPAAPAAAEPAACKGLPAAQLQKLAGEVLAGR